MIRFGWYSRNSLGSLQTYFFPFTTLRAVIIFKPLLLCIPSHVILSSEHRQAEFPCFYRSYSAVKLNFDSFDRSLHICRLLAKIISIFYFCGSANWRNMTTKNIFRTHKLIKLISFPINNRWISEFPSKLGCFLLNSILPHSFQLTRLFSK